jgi:hypothetical protein
MVTSAPCAADATLPSCPSGIETATAPDGVTLSWTPGSDGDFVVESQAIYRDGARIAMVYPDTATYLDARVPPTAHSYAVTTFNQAAGESTGCAAASTAAIVVAPAADRTTAEGGATSTFTVVLGSQPTADVAVTIESSDTGEVTVSPALLTFTPADWGAARTVTLSGVDDDLDDGDQPFVVAVTAASADPVYAAIDPTDATGANADDDPKAPGGLQARAAGGPAVELAWLDTTGDETGFRLERREAGEPAFALLADLPAGTTAHHDAAGLSAGTTYYYRVRAVGSGYAGPWSNVASAVVPLATSPFCRQRLTGHESAANPVLEFGAGGFGLVYREVQPASSALVFSRLDPGGAVVAGPVTVSAWAGHSAAPVLRWSGSEWGVLWFEELAQTWGLFFQRLSPDGDPIGAAVRVDEATSPIVPGNTRNRGLAWDGAGWGRCSSR